MRATRSGTTVLALATLFAACGGKTTEPLQPEPIDGGDDILTDTPIPPTDVPVPPPDVPVLPPPTPTDKVDLLLVVDNSSSMADKQLELARRIPVLIKALTNPDVDATGKPKTQRVADLHVGVITSSLGSHGTSACDPSVTNLHNDDRGHLLPRAGEKASSGWTVDPSGTPTPAACPTPVAASPLTWAYDPTATATYLGAAGSPGMQAATSCVVSSASEDGCGYEETLEAMYHFLIDPAPYTSAVVKCTFGVSGDACGTNKIVVSGLDTELLAQRKAFLRPDSSVVIVILSDENDFSLKPAALNWLPWGYGAGMMQRGWAACSSVPDEFEPETPAEYSDLHSTYNCYSCFENASDPNCKVPWAKDKLNNDIDGRNLRGFHQVQRVGYNFLWGRRRYVDALNQATVIGSDGKMGTNPLFMGGLRVPSNVILAAIVGVPTQLVNGPTGVPKTLGAADWDKIVGPITGRDPHMIESIAPRDGIKKYAGDPSVDPVNGGDRDVFDGDDLQYACIGPRATDEKAADCEGPSPETKNPLCAAGGKQPRFKAYPGLRHLRVVRELGTQGYVASICDSNFGGAMRGLVDKLQPLIKK
jgi:hypothetical protein